MRQSISLSYSFYSFLLTISLCLIHTIGITQVIYKIEGKGIKKQSYIFGAWQPIDKTIINKFDNVIPYLEQSEQFLLQGFPHVTDLNKAIFGSIRLNYGKNLFDYMQDPRATQQLFYALKEKGLSLEDIKYFKPAFTELLLAQPQQPNIIFNSYQEYFEYNSRKSPTFLQTVEDFKKPFNEMSIHEQVANLTYYLSNKDFGARMRNYYLADDLFAMYNIVLRSSSPYILDNYRIASLEMTYTIEQSIRYNSCFIVVGALYLQGKNGIINNLKKLGYTVSLL